MYVRIIRTITVFHWFTINCNFCNVLYTECSDDPKHVEARDFMRNLKEKRLVEHLHEENIVEYYVHWDDLGRWT